jgi:phosphoribosyl 1,2-cyclic phosphodiesterase
MIVISLQSGSNGNCTYVESGHTRLLFDAGISGRQAELRLAAFGRDIRSVDAVFVSHDHRDHVERVGVLHRKFGMPIYVTPDTLAAARRFCNLGRLSDVRHFAVGERIQIDGVAVETAATAHDAADGAGFVVEGEGKRLGVLTDLGHPFAELAPLVQSLDAVLLESNYDDHMLSTGPYSPALQARIRGAGGHLSNAEAAELLDGAVSRLQWACLSHLSEQNNHPEVALATHRAVLKKRLPVVAASRTQPVMLPEV